MRLISFKLLKANPTGSVVKNVLRHCAENKPVALAGHIGACPSLHTCPPFKQLNFQRWRIYEYKANGGKGQLAPPVAQLCCCCDVRDIQAPYR